MNSRVKRKIGRPPIYPFSKMHVGEARYMRTRQRETVRRAAYQFGYTRGWSFTTRATPTGLRISRVA